MVLAESLHACITTCSVRPNRNACRRSIANFVTPWLGHVRRTTYRHADTLTTRAKTTTIITICNDKNISLGGVLTVVHRGVSTMFPGSYVPR